MLEKLKTFIENPFPFVANTGVQLEHIERGCAKLVMPFEGNGNHINTMYAGAMFTLAEMAGGALCFSSFDMSNFYPVVKDFKITYKAPATTDVSVEARLTEEKLMEIAELAAAQGKAEFVVETELKNTNGDVLALTVGTFQLRKSGK